MDVLQAIAERRAVREFTSALISQEMMRDLIDSAILAPSARNLQPWSFAVVLDRDRIEGHAQNAKEWLLANQTPELGAMATMIEDARYSLFHHAPALLIILATDASRQSAEDCCLAAQNLMLAARARNLGTCWIGLSRPWLNLPETKLQLGLPSRYQVVAPIIVGHPQAWPDPQERSVPEINWLDG
jgi:nitroreductase